MCCYLLKRLDREDIQAANSANQRKQAIDDLPLPPHAEISLEFSDVTRVLQ